MLASGDLDGDEYAIVDYAPLMPIYHADPTECHPVQDLQLQRNCVIEDIIRFVLRFIHGFGLLLHVRTIVLMTISFSAEMFWG